MQVLQPLHLCVYVNNLISLIGPSSLILLESINVIITLLWVLWVQFLVLFLFFFFFILLLILLVEGIIKMDVIAVSSDVVFNHFFSIGVYWGFVLAGFFGALSLLRV